ncbi:MAG: hypothetical protein MZW92_27475 [Comamonadaceae bacterium]|nr:hypothetical protein [Comamonadaceae bacterium]
MPALHRARRAARALPLPLRRATPWRPERGAERDDRAPLLEFRARLASASSSGSTPVERLRASSSAREVARARPCTRSTASSFGVARRARSSAWSASRAAASPRSAGSAAGCIAPTEGDVLYRGVSRSTAGGRPAAARSQMIFQDPFASLNPRMRVGEIVGEAPRVHGLVAQARGRRLRGRAAARASGSTPATRAATRTSSPAASGRASASPARWRCKPEFLICDEAVAALDVSIQAQVLNLFMDLREQLGLTYLFISHDLGVVRHLSDRVVVMYLGRVVEIAADRGAVRARRNHPYTQALLAEVPRIDRKRAHASCRSRARSRRRWRRRRAVPSTCAARRPRPRRRTEVPAPRDVGASRRVACHARAQRTRHAGRSGASAHGER